MKSIKGTVKKEKYCQGEKVLLVSGGGISGQEIPAGWSTQMRGYLGAVIELPSDVSINGDFRFYYDGWVFTYDNIVGAVKNENEMEYILEKNDLVFAKINPKAIIPTKRDEDAGYDVYPCLPDGIDYQVIPYMMTRLIPTGIAFACHKSKYIDLKEKSGTGAVGIKLSAGVIDSGYRGEWFAAIINMLSDGSELVISSKTKQELFEIAKENIKKLNESNPEDRDVMPYLVIDHNKPDTFDNRLHLDKSNLDLITVRPTNKAIVQAIVREVIDVNPTEMSYEELMRNFSSERGTGCCGSTGK